MIGPKDPKLTKLGYQPQKTSNKQDSIKGYQPKVKQTEDQLNPPSGGSNVVQQNSQTETDKG